jgi:hypothetical protein
MHVMPPSHRMAFMRSTHGVCGSYMGACEHLIALRIRHDDDFF